MEEDQARLLAFQNGELDLMNLGGTARAQRARRRQAQARIRRRRASSCRGSSIRRSSTCTGTCRTRSSAGLSKEKIALRRAMAMAYNVDDEIKVVRNGQAIEAAVSDSARRRRPRSELSLAGQVRPGGARTRCSTSSATRRVPTAGATFPTASRSPSAMRRGPIRSAGSSTRCGRRRSTAIGVRMEVQKDKFPELLKLERQCKLMMRIGVVDRRLPGCRQLHAAPLRQEHRPEQQRLREDPGIRQALRAVDPDARLAGARQAVPRDDAHHRGLRAVAARHGRRTATCWSSRACWATRSTRSCMRNGSTSMSRRAPGNVPSAAGGKAVPD